MIGGSVVGSAAALLFARSGWSVTVIDPEFDHLIGPDLRVAPRPGAPHVVQAHGFMSRVLLELRQRLPDIVDALEQAGCEIVPLSAITPPALYDGGRVGDDDLAGLRARRLVLDRVLAAAVVAHPAITRVRSRVTDLLLDESGAVPRVLGVACADGTRVEAELVLDAAGRRSPVAGWLQAAGHPLAERVDPCSLRYYTRHFQVDEGLAPALNNGFLEAHQFPSFQQFIFRGDNSTAMMALAVHDTDPLFKSARHESVYMAIAHGNPALAGWMSALTPTTPVFCLGALDNRYRTTVREGRPVVLGLQPVGDALAMTNPSRGRGVAMGLAAVGMLHDLADAAAGEEDVVFGFHAWQESSLAVYYREAAAADRTTDRTLRASVEGVPAPAKAPGIELPARHPVSSDEIDQAANLDPDLFRIALRAGMMLDDHRVIASDEVAADVRRVLAAVPAETSAAVPQPVPTDGLHDRATLEALLTALP